MIDWQYEAAGFRRKSGFCRRVPGFFPENGYRQTTMLQILREQQQVLAFLVEPDMHDAAQSVMEKLFRRLAMRYEFSLDGLLPPEKC